MNAGIPGEPTGARCVACGGALRYGAESITMSDGTVKHGRCADAMPVSVRTHLWYYALALAFGLVHATLRYMGASNRVLLWSGLGGFFAVVIFGLVRAQRERRPNSARLPDWWRRR